MILFPDVSGVVIVVCVAVLMVVIVSVSYHLYLKHVQEVPDAHTQLKEEKDLDLSALTITVNPLEVSVWMEKAAYTSNNNNLNYEFGQLWRECVFLVIIKQTLAM